MLLKAAVRQWYINRVHTHQAGGTALLKSITLEVSQQVDGDARNDTFDVPSRARSALLIRSQATES